MTDDDKARLGKIELHGPLYNPDPEMDDLTWLCLKLRASNDALERVCEVRDNANYDRHMIRPDDLSDAIKGGKP